MYLLIWLLNIDTPLHSGSFIWLYDNLKSALAAADWELEKSEEEEVLFSKMINPKYGYHDVVKGWKSPQGEHIFIIKLKVR